MPRLEKQNFARGGMTDLEKFQIRHPEPPSEARRVEGSPQSCLGASFEEELSPKVTEVVLMLYGKFRSKGHHPPAPLLGGGKI